jgi:succinylglutamate desuccinylase
MYEYDLTEEELALELGAASQFVPRCLRVRNHFCHRHLTEEQLALELGAASQFAPHHLREVKSLPDLVLPECLLYRP